jgi:Uma2 family endonuclease
MTVGERLITLADLESLPDDGKKRDVIDGALYEVNPPKPRHNLLQSRLVRYLGNYVEAKELGVVMPEVGCKLSTTPLLLLTPDVVYLANERFSSIDLDEYITSSPDIAIEIVSPGNTFQELSDKVREYLAHGSELVWVVYPDSRIAHIHQKDSEVRAVDINGALDGGTVLQGFILSMRDLFKGL